jgi:hypothetical protein
MEIGEEKPAIVIEPIEEPVPGERTPAPVEPEPVEAPEHEPVPA